MENTAEIQMGSSPASHFRHPLISLAVLLLMFSVLTISLLSTAFLTLLVLILSTVVFLTFIKKKETMQENITVQNDKHSEMEVGLKTQPLSEVAGPEKETHNDGSKGQIDQATAASPDLLSDSEGIDLPSSTSNDSEADWSFQYNISQLPAACSDGSISDDDSLIEIALPGRQYIGSDESESDGLFWANPLEFLPEPVFHQDELKEMLSEIDEINEVNEEDNLIEIDISVGSIKCPRVEIEA